MLYILELVYETDPDTCDRTTEYRVVESDGQPFAPDYVPEGATMYRACSHEAHRLQHMPRAHRPRFRAVYAALLRHHGTPEESIRTAVLDWADPHHHRQTEAA